MEYDVGLACLNGHEINGSSQSKPEFNAKFCQECGELTINACPECGTKIRGDYGDEWDGVPWTLPKYCHDCGEPYPWTKRRMEALAAVIDELEQLNEDEQGKLKESIPDVTAQTPKSGLAVARFEKALAKAGEFGKKVLTESLSKVASVVVLRSLGIP